MLFNNFAFWFNYKLFPFINRVMFFVVDPIKTSFYQEKPGERYLKLTIGFLLLYLLCRDHDKKDFLNIFINTKHKFNGKRVNTKFYLKHNLLPIYGFVTYVEN